MLRPIATTIAGLLVFITASAAMTQDSNEAAFIESLANQAVETLRDQSLPLESREARFRDLLRDGFAIDKIGRFVIGKYWRQMTPEQQDDYLELYGEWVLKTYSSRLGGYSGQTFEVTKTVKTDKGDIFVSSRINHPDYAEPVRVDWRVRNIDGRPKVIDIVVEGISMLVTQRSEFSAVLGKDGIDGLLDTMRVRVSKFPAMSG
jgi:phospholipid transport system substrate-binding protein